MYYLHYLVNWPMIYPSFCFSGLVFKCTHIIIIIIICKHLMYILLLLYILLYIPVIRLETLLHIIIILYMRTAEQTDRTDKIV